MLSPHEEPAHPARASLDAGLRFLQSDDLPSAARWLDRAHRLAPEDPTIVLALAASLAGSDPARAERLLADASARHPNHRPLRIALAAAAARRGDDAGAAARLQPVLSTGAIPDDAGFAAFATEVAARAGRPGWVGVDATGRLHLAGPATLWLDGVRLAAASPADLPPSWRSARRLVARRRGRALLGSPLDLAAMRGTEAPVPAAGPETAPARLTPRAWAAGRRPAAIVLVTHADGGGVERHVRARARDIAQAGDRAIILRPAAQGWSISDGRQPARSRLIAGAATLDPLLAVLAADRPRAVELHHTASHHPAIDGLAARLGVPYAVSVHDFAMICPRITLVDGQGRYCGEPDTQAACERCVAEHGSRLDGAAALQPVGSLRDRTARLLHGADRILVPSEDAARRLRRFLPGVRPPAAPPLTVQPWEDDAALAAGVPRLPPRPRQPSGRALHVCIAGAIGQDKGYDVLLACAEDAAARALPLRFTVVGHTIGDERLMQTGRVFVTGRYEEDEAVALIGAQGADVGFLPSIWPESWCYALSALWRAGLWTLAFALGAQGERIARTGAGRTLPAGLPAPRINDAFTSLCTGSSRNG